ncbi:Transthyretin-like family protein [Teladorsagia circumcincta]|uniref:Transthyretin-like family protein n=1 Tax=Teladorsagia circumcincta TaxID=45464 RepID=A0A2G9U782_TELCI|nr:Transthyretin-like family protein [Teladorsagia circumcincta]
MRTRLFLLLLSFPLLLHALLTQSLGIRGTLRCGTNPLGNRTVQLYDKRKPPFSDKLLASNTTDSSGLFYLTGTAARVLPLSPLLEIEGDCKGRKRKIKLPSSKTDVTRTKDVVKFNDVGIINLNMI